MKPERATAPIKSRELKTFRVSVRVPQKLKNRLERVVKNSGLDEADIVRMALLRQLPLFEKAVSV